MTGFSVISVPPETCKKTQGFAVVVVSGSFCHSVVFMYLGGQRGPAGTEIFKTKIPSVALRLVLLGLGRQRPQVDERVRQPSGSIPHVSLRVLIHLPILLVSEEEKDGGRSQEPQ